MSAVICPYEGLCGGCGLQAQPYAEQLVAKAEALVARLPAAVTKTVRQSELFLPVFPMASHPAAFRQKVAFVFGNAPGGRGLTMGHYARGTNAIVPVDDCPVHSRRGNRIAFALRDALARARIAAAGPALTGLVRHLLIRTTRDDGEAVAMLVVTRNDKRLRVPVRTLLASANRPDGFFVNVHDEPGPYMVGRETLKIEGRAQIREQVGGVSYLVSPTAFFQTNVQAAEVLQQYVLATPGMTAGARVLDLYAGSGLFSLALVRAGAEVVAVEENRRAIQDAAANVRLNRMHAEQIRLIAARVEEALARLGRERWDAVVLDPPRQGCPPEVLDRVFRGMAPPVAVYVSCNPDALARELPTILAAGYRVADVRAVDMFPHTDHIETVVRLVRRQK